MFLKGDPHPNSPRELNPEARRALSKVEDALNRQRAVYCDYTRSWDAYVFATIHTPTAVLWQGGALRWIHLSVTPARVLTPYYDLIAALIQQAREESHRYFGREPNTIYVPYTQQQMNWLWQSSNSWGIALAGYAGTIENHYPPNKLLQFYTHHPVIFPVNVSQTPLNEAITVFMDGSSNGLAAFVVNSRAIRWQTTYSSAQEVELAAVLQVLLTYPSTPLNVFSDSQYIVRGLQVIETVPFIGTANSTIQTLFRKVQEALQERACKCYFGHLRAHSPLPGPLSEGNQLADEATQVWLTQEQMAQHSHSLHHQNANSLRLQFRITREAARQIVKQCSACPTMTSVPNYGVNPRGLLPNHLWQMDVTHIPSFGKLKYVHVTIDTYSGFLVATPLSGESSSHVITHCLRCFSILGQPKVIKTDNGPGYTGKKFQIFCAKLEINLKTGIPYNPQGQGIVERAHQTLKTQLEKVKRGELYPLTPQNYLNHTLFILNFLILDAHGRSAAQRLWSPQRQNKKALVRWKDPLGGKWYGPDPVLIWGRGHVCVFPQDAEAPRWLPLLERLVRHAEECSPAGDQDEGTEPEGQGPSEPGSGDKADPAYLESDEESHEGS